MDTILFVSRVFTVLGQNVVKENTSDLIIEIPKAVEALNEGKEVCILCRHNGADNIERFRDCLRERGNTNASYKVAMDYCERTLGWELRVFLNDNWSVKIGRNPDCERMSDYDEECLVYRFADFGISAEVE